MQVHRPEELNHSKEGSMMLLKRFSIYSLISLILQIIATQKIPHIRVNNLFLRQMLCYADFFYIQ